MDFGLKQHDPTGRKVWYTIPTMPSIGRLYVAYAGRSNMGYTSALAKLTTKTGVARRMARGQVDADTLKQNLDFDRALFPRHVIFDMDGGIDMSDPAGKKTKPMLDASGNPVPFSVEVVRDLLKQLPAWVMEDLSNFCGIAGNFLSDDTPSHEDFAEQAQD